MKKRFKKLFRRKSLPDNEEKNMNEGEKAKKFNKNSLTIRLLLIPIIVLVFAIGIMGFVSTKNTQDSLLEDMDRNGQMILHEFVRRLEDNEQALEIVNGTIEDRIRMV